MSKDSISDFDTTADNNTDIGGIEIEGADNVANFDNAFRELMAQLKTEQTSKQAAIDAKENTLGFTPVNKAGDTSLGDMVHSNLASIRFPHANQTGTDDGKIASGVHDEGLNIIGTQTVSGKGRKTRFYGTVLKPENPSASWTMTCGTAKTTSILRNVGSNASLVAATASGFSGNYVRFTAPVDGTYVVTVNPYPATAGSSDLLIYMYGSYSFTVNAIRTIREIIDLRNISNIQEPNCFTLVMYLSEGDTLEPDVYRSSTSFVDTAATMHVSVDFLN
jgi:hypothetical protein